jgi:hypothetical protein
VIPGHIGPLSGIEIETAPPADGAPIAAAGWTPDEQHPPSLPDIGHGISSAFPADAIDVVYLLTGCTGRSAEVFFHA